MKSQKVINVRGYTGISLDKYHAMRYYMPKKVICIKYLII